MPSATEVASTILATSVFTKARAARYALNYGHPGVMTIPHLAMEEFLQAAAIEIKDIPFQHFQGASLQLFWNIYAINIFAFNHNARQSRGFIEYPRCCLPASQSPWRKNSLCHIVNC